MAKMEKILKLIPVMDNNRLEKHWVSYATAITHWLHALGQNQNLKSKFFILAQSKIWVKFLSNLSFKVEN